MSLHKQVCWISNLSDRYPNISFLPLMNRLIDVPGLRNVLRKRIIYRISPRIRPSEGRNIYHNYAGLDNTCRLDENDISQEMEKKLKKAIVNHIAFTGKKRFLTKQTANCQRIRAIHAMFPDAYFIHLVRDGRAVANSLNKVSWWKETDIWWFGGRPDDWAAAGKEPIELCALQWRRDVEEILNNKAILGHRYLEIRYEDFVSDIHKCIHRVLEFCDLEDDHDFHEIIPRNLAVNMNYKWDVSLTQHQKEVVLSSIGDLLERLGYVTASGDTDKIQDNNAERLSSLS